MFYISIIHNKNNKDIQQIHSRYFDVVKESLQKQLDLCTGNESERTNFLSFITNFHFVYLD